MHITLVVNPAATNVSPTRISAVQELLQARHEVSVQVTRHRDHATELATEAVRAGTDCVAVLGGDGTLNEVINALAGTDCAIAVLPGGSTNVFARTLGLPDDLRRAARATSDALASGWVHRIGLGAVNGRYFTFHTGVGFDAAVVSRVETHNKLKHRIGHALFLYCGLREFFLFDRKSPQYLLQVSPPTGSINSGNPAVSGYFAVVQNTDPYTFLGHRPFTVAPTATLDRGLTVTSVGELSVRRFLPVILGALANRKGVRTNQTIRRWEDIDHATITHAPQAVLQYQVDGDYLGEAESLEFTHHPNIVSIVLPIVPR
ncbi:MAG: diacylglycerol kinase family protein [Microthrixaceae bacterium]